MGQAATTTLSTKGQVVIPEDIRSRLGLKPGTQFVVIADRDAVIFKVLERETGLTREEVKKAIAKVRRSK
jgi:AbrB family looped-hinge helix DNA binding protein